MKEARFEPSVGSWSVLAAAATERPALIVLVIGLLCAAVVGSLAILGPGVALYASVVGCHLVRPAYRRKVREAEQRRPVQLPLPSDFRHGVLGSATRAMRLSRLARERAAQVLPPVLRATAEPALERSSALEVAALRLMTQADRLTRWLDGINVVELRAELARAGQLAETAASGPAQQSYLFARRAREEQLRLYEQIAASRDACLAALAPVIAALDDLPFHLARLRFVEAELDAGQDPLRQDSQVRLRRDVAQLYETVEALGELSPRAV